MKNSVQIFIVLFPLLMVSCQSTKDSNPSIPELAESTITEELNDDCARGIAEPIVDKQVFPNTKFELQSDKKSGLETVQFLNGDQLLIENTGCEYYTLIFQFENNRFNAKFSDVDYWYSAIYELMQETIKGIDAPIDLKKGLEALDAYKKENLEAIDYDTEVVYEPSEIGSYFNFQGVEKLADGKTKLTIFFYVGPL